MTGDREWWTSLPASAGRGRKKDEEAGNNSISQANEHLRQSVSRLYDLQFAPSSSELQSQPIATNQQQLQQQQPIREEGGAEGKRKSKGKEAKVKDRSFDTFSELAASNRLPSAPVTFLTGLTLTFICIYFMYVKFDLILFKHYFLTLNFIKKLNLICTIRIRRVLLLTLV